MGTSFEKKRGWGDGLLDGISLPVFGSGSSRDFVLGSILFLAVVLVYSPVRDARFLWDDDVVLTANPCIVGPLGLKEIWTQATSEPDFAPLTRSTFWLEHKLWGMAPDLYHVVNVLMHGACALLLWRVLLGLQVPGAWLGAALWALHPVEVESVAWVAELKNTESGIFFLLTIFFFVKWLNRKERDAPFRPDRTYTLTLFCGVLAMLCKASTVILPIILLLCAWWQESRWRWRNWIAVAPLLLMGIVVTLLSISGQTEQTTTSTGLRLDRSWPERIVTAADAVWFYLGKLIWPSPLAAIYPRWNIDAGWWISYVPLAGLILSVSILWNLRLPWARACFFAFAYFLTALLPVLGLVNNTIFIYAPVFDHLQYLASNGTAGAGGRRLGPAGGIRRPE